jgi:hypothetical protein
MAEQSYVGYRPQMGPDWGKLTSEFAQGLLDISGRRAEQNIYLDRVTQENIDLVRENDEFSDQTFNDFVMGGATQGVDNAYNINKLVKAGKISHNEFRMFHNRANSSFKAVSDMAKSIDTNIQAMKDRQLTDENGIPQGSVIEEKMMEYQVGLLDLKNRTLYQDPKTGQYYNGQLNAETGVVEDLQNPEASLKPINQRDNYFDAFGFVKKRSDALATVKVSEVRDVVTGQDANGNDIVVQQYITESGESLNENLDKAIANTQQHISTDPRLAFQTLDQIDGRYELFIDENDYREQMDEKIGIENKVRYQKGMEPMSEEELFYFEQDQGRFMVPFEPNAARVRQPVLNREQTDVLLKGIEDMYKQNLSYSRVDPKPTTTKAPGSNKKTKKDPGYELYKDIYTAIEEKNVDKLQSLTGNKYKFVINDDNTLTVTKEVKDPNDDRDVIQEPVYTGSVTLDTAYPLFFGSSSATGTIKPADEYERQKNAFYKATNKPVIAMEQTDEVIEEQPRSILERIRERFRGNNVA